MAGGCSSSSDTCPGIYSVYNPPDMYFREKFTEQEELILQRFFTNTDRPVFALINLPEVVKGALFARYSRTHKSLRRVFLDEFYSQPDIGIQAIAESSAGESGAPDTRRAERLYERVLGEYGDDSVAQLGGAHVACEQASNILTKVLEWGRLAAYLEQSTRYIYYDRKLGGRYRYLVPPEIRGSDHEGRYREEMDRQFETYSSIVRRLTDYFAARFPRAAGDSVSAYGDRPFGRRPAIRREGCSLPRHLSNVGIFGTGQAYESLLLRMRASQLAEVRDYSSLLLDELRTVIPAFVRRVDVPDRGGAWSDYLRRTADSMEGFARELEVVAPRDVPEVELTDWDPDAETKVAAAALYAFTDLPDGQLLELAEKMPYEEKARVIRAYAGERLNRRHKPGRGAERVSYRFDILSDFGSFRDLQRHRMLTLEWQPLGVSHGYSTPPDIVEAHESAEWHEAMDRMASLHSVLLQAHGTSAAQYAVPFSYRLRYVMQLNAREAFHLLELRTTPQGHPDYRRVCQEMHRLIRDVAGHKVIAETMKYVDHRSYDLERLEAERRSANRRETTSGDRDSPP